MHWLDLDNFIEYLEFLDINKSLIVLFTLLLSIITLLLSASSTPKAKLDNSVIFNVIMKDIANLLKL